MKLNFLFVYELQNTKIFFYKLASTLEIPIHFGSKDKTSLLSCTPVNLQKWHTILILTNYKHWRGKKNVPTYFQIQHHLRTYDCMHIYTTLPPVFAFFFICTKISQRGHEHISKPKGKIDIWWMIKLHHLCGIRIYLTLNYTHNQVMEAIKVMEVKNESHRKSRSCGEKTDKSKSRS